MKTQPNLDMNMMINLANLAHARGRSLLVWDLK
jgi:hypothetical protein